MQKKKKMVIEELPIEMVDPPKEGRRIDVDETELAELAKSIAERGQLQAIQVVKKGERYEVSFGKRRYLACLLLGKEKILGVVVEKDENEVLIDRAVENLQRVNLSPYEEALQYSNLIEKTGKGFEAVGKMTGRSGGSVKRSIEILKMPEYLQKALHKKLISKGVAEELNGCKDGAQREYLTEMAVAHGITVAIARKWVDDWKKLKRVERNDVGEGVSLGYTPEREPVYDTCFFCKGATEVEKIEYVKSCGACKAELIAMLSKRER